MGYVTVLEHERMYVRRKWAMNWPSLIQLLALDDLAVGTNIDLNETASRSHSFWFLLASRVRSTRPAGPKITLCFPHLYLSLCVRTYHMRNNCITYIVAMQPYLSWLWQFRRLHFYEFEMDTEKQRQRRRDDTRLTESGDARSKQQLLVMPTELLVTNGEWLPGELLSWSKRQMPGWFLDMNIRLVPREFEYIMRFIAFQLNHKLANGSPHCLD